MGAALEAAKGDMEAALEAAKADVGTALEAAKAETGAALEAAKGEVGAALEAAKAETGAALEAVKGDMGAALETAKQEMGSELEDALQQMQVCVEGEVQRSAGQLLASLPPTARCFVLLYCSTLQSQSRTTAYMTPLTSMCPAATDRLPPTCFLVANPPAPHLRLLCSPMLPHAWMRSGQPGGSGPWQPA